MDINMISIWRFEESTRKIIYKWEIGPLMSIAMFHYQRVKPCKTYDFEYRGINTHNQLSDVSSRASGFCDQDTVTFEKSWHSTGSWRLSESMIAFQSAIGEETQNQWSPLSTLHATSILLNAAVKLLSNSGFFWKMILQARSHCYACTSLSHFFTWVPMCCFHWHHSKEWLF